MKTRIVLLTTFAFLLSLISINAFAIPAPNDSPCMTLKGTALRGDLNFTKIRVEQVNVAINIANVIPLLGNLNYNLIGTISVNHGPFLPFSKIGMCSVYNGSIQVTIINQQVWVDGVINDTPPFIKMNTVAHWYGTYTTFTGNLSIGRI